MDLGGINDTLALSAAVFGAAASVTTNSEIHDHIVRVGVNYKLN
jgi:hypothetical protein